MSPTDIISLVMSLVGVGSFCAVFTILFAKYAKSNIKETKEGKRDIELIDTEITEQDIKTKRRRKAASIAGNVIFYAFLAVILPLFAVALVNKIQGNLVGIGNESMLVVASGSMSYKNEANEDYLENEELRSQYDLDNQFARYDILFVKGVEKEEDIHLYDVVAFYNFNADAIYIHRVIKIDVNSSGTTRYTTRGDANNASDAPITFAEIKGVYEGKKVPGLGMIILFFQSPHGIITVLSVVYSIWMFNHFASKMEKAERDRTKLLGAIISDVDYGKEKNIASSFEETIRYSGYSYRFNEKGFLGKDDDSSSSGSSSLTKTVSTPSGVTSSTYRMGETPEMDGELEDTIRYEEDEAPSQEEELADEEKDY